MRTVTMRDSRGEKCTISSNHPVFRLMFPPTPIPLLRTEGASSKVSANPVFKGLSPKKCHYDRATGEIVWADSAKSGRPMEFARFVWAIYENGVDNGVGTFHSVAGTHPYDRGIDRVTDPKTEGYVRVRRSEACPGIVIREDVVPFEDCTGRDYSLTFSGLPLEDV